LFEIGRVFAGSSTGELRDDLPNEREALGLIATGGALEEGRAQAVREIDFYRTQRRVGGGGRCD